MTGFTLFIFGVVVGSLLTSSWISARNRWKKARGMLKAPNKAKDEGRTSIKKAKSEAAKGRSEIFRAGFAIFLIVLVLVIGVLVAGFIMLA